MEYIKRNLESYIKESCKYFPVVSVMGPRQSGKSTLLKQVFKNYDYYNLEDPQTRMRASVDPVGFVRSLTHKTIIDEAQRVPELFSMIQVVADEKGEKGMFILSGSQNFLLLKRIGQSLAGRVALAKLLPFCYSELIEGASENLGRAEGSESAPEESMNSRHTQTTQKSSDEYAFLGGYPRLNAEKLPRDMFFENYIDTYIERDVADYMDVRNKNAFNQLLYLLANQSGNLLNVTRLSCALNVSFQTVKSWLSILESSYTIFFLQPFYKNSSKSLTKTPKVYFWDCGLLCYLLGITDENQMVRSEHFGAIFENMIVAEAHKKHLNAGRKPLLYFYRDDSKREIDLLDFTDRNKMLAHEIKCSMTYSPKFARHLNSVGEEIGIAVENRSVICRVEGSYNHDGVNVLKASDWLLM